MQKRNQMPRIVIQAPVPPVMNNSSKIKVRYTDLESVSKAKKYKETAEKETGWKIYIYYCHRWSDGQGYDISDSDVGCDSCILTDYDILRNVRRKEGIKQIDGDEIFQTYEMIYGLKV